MKDRAALARRAVAAALDVRQRHSSAKLWESICPFDVSERMGMEVQFHAIPSLEALYFKLSPPTVFVGTLRPAGRRGYNVAHEIGHHVFGHGTTVHEVREERFAPVQDAKEFAADVFASFLLMPKVAVSKAFHDRNFAVETATAEEMFLIAGYFGVGYTTLIFHLQHNLQFLTARRAEELRRALPYQLRQGLARLSTSELLIVDERWKGRPVDVRVGEHILVPNDTIVEGRSLELLHSGSHLLAVGVVPGISRIVGTSGGWSVYARVSRARYVGRSIFRHDPDPEDI